MNRIKYIHPRSGNTIAVKIGQPSYSVLHRILASFRGWNTPPVRLTMVQADEQMARGGYVRAGLRWRGADARSALKNALVDNARLSKP